MANIYVRDVYYSMNVLDKFLPAKTLSSDEGKFSKNSDKITKLEIYKEKWTSFRKLSFLLAN